MKKNVEKCLICLREDGITYRLCELIQTIDGSDFSYVFIPRYEVLDLLPGGCFDGIQGLDLTLRKKEYRREGIPVFLSERIPPENREDLQEILATCRLDYFDPIQLFLRSRERYSGDSLFALPFEGAKDVKLQLSSEKDTYPQIKAILQNLANGNRVKLNGRDQDGRTLFGNLYPIYRFSLSQKQKNQRVGAAARKSRGSYRGRKEIPFVKDDFRKIVESYRRKESTIDEALSLSGLSKSTFFRRCKKYHL